MSCGDGTRYRATLLERRRLSEKVFELRLDRPAGFLFSAGQGICLGEGSGEREYSLASGPREPALALCIRRVDQGRLSTWLAGVPPGQELAFSGPHGLFTWQESPRTAVFVATGTGIAPFVSMTRDGRAPLVILHGVRAPQELSYREWFTAGAFHYVPCVSAAPATGAFHGRVTEWIRGHLAPGGYDFYLCGRREMIRDVTALVDDNFPGSRVFAEIFH